MAQGYTRTSSTKTDGDTLLATDWNSEFDALQAAFDTVAGHNHDGSAGGGAKIDLAGSVTGSLSVENGGTGRATFTANGVLYGNTTAGLNVTAAPTFGGEVLVANGSGVPTWGPVNVQNENAVTGQLPVANGGTGASSEADARTNLGLDVIATKLSNLSAAADPTATDDGTDGYSVGSIWVNTSTNTIFMCADPTNSSAVWVQISNV